MCEYTPLHVCAWGGQKRVSDSLEPELWAVWHGCWEPSSCPLWEQQALLLSHLSCPSKKEKKRKKKNHSLPSLDFKKIWKRNPLAISLGVGYLFLAVSAASILWWEECKVKPSDSSRWNEMSRGPVSWWFSEAGEFKSSGKDSLIVPQWQPWQTIIKIQMATA